MAKEYKFMFDRRFDDAEDDTFSAPADMTTKSVDGIPSISELLDTLNTRMENTEERLEESAESQTEQEQPAEDDTPAPEPETPPPAEPAPPVSLPEPEPKVIFKGFSQEELDAAKEQAFTQGKLEGQAEGHKAAWDEAMASVEKQTADSLELILEQLRALAPVAAETAEKSYAAAVDLAMAVCRKVVPTLCKERAADEIRLLLEKNFHFLKEEPKITVRLNPSMADAVKPYITDLVKKESFAGKVAVVRDESIPAGNCKIEWKHGGVERTAQDVLNQTEELLKLYHEGDKSNG
ncbi:MAG TPA: hypothetical protein DD624_06685 [Alphaproteobacteria bacterium]|nr:hypothetical protein [Alphaproteobacteria bacterium]